MDKIIRTQKFSIIPRSNDFYNYSKSFFPLILSSTHNAYFDYQNLAEHGVETFIIKIIDRGKYEEKKIV